MTESTFRKTRIHIRKVNATMAEAGVIAGMVFDAAHEFVGNQPTNKYWISDELVISPPYCQELNLDK